MIATERAEALEIRQAMTNSDTAEAVKTLETLDENSLVLAKTYLSALADRQQLERARAAAGTAAAVV